ncbi:hypothetical protein H4K36_25225 [Streptomyces sp. DHE7-1]|uniref:hypothetical protein n=1 Tax=Streptomyces sp. NPDC093248 TaxID=3155072 RepID=UPI0018EE74FF|nr:hypothetical protein [Streptomyces sp. DHE7-1]
MAEQWSGVAAPGRDSGRAARLPDLTDVDLRTLRFLDDPALTAAVDRVLRDATGCQQVWHSGEGEGEVQPSAVDMFSAGLAEPGLLPDERR